MECESCRISLSALLDGEANHEETLAALDHLTVCPTCARFYRQARGLQALAAHLQDAPRPQPLRHSGRAVRGWAWAGSAAAAALLILAIGLHGPRTRDEAAGEAPATIAITPSGRPMSEDRLVELAVELLSADARSQREMIQVLDQAARGRSKDQSAL